MFRNLVFAVLASFTLSASANTSTNLPANTITISATIDKKDVVTIRGDKVWITHGKGELPSDVKINGNAWTPVWDDNESDTFTMKDPARFLPMSNQRSILSISHPKTATVIEYPDVVNEWMLVIALSNADEEPVQVDLTISWNTDDFFPIVLPNHSVPNTKPDPTPTGLR
jgi:hypothetical protein